MRLMLLLGVTLLAAISAVSCIGVFAGEQAEGTERRELALSDPSVLDLAVHSVNGHVKVFGEANRSSVSLDIEKIAYGETDSEARARLDEIEVVIDQVGDVISVRVEYPKRFIERNSPTVHFNVYVPANVKQLDISSVNGHVKVSSVTASNQIDLTSVNGHVELNGDSPLIDLVTTNGHIDVFAQGDVHLSTANGSIDGRVLGQSVDVHTVNGSVNLDLEGANQGSINTVNGGIDLSIIETSDISIEARSGFGRISMYGFEDISIDRRMHGSRAVGTQGSPNSKLTLSTSNGSIRVDRTETSQ